MLKNLTLSFVTCLLLTLNLNARKMPGRIIFSNNDTLVGTLIIPIKFISQRIIFEEIQEEVVFIDTSGRREVVNPYFATEIQFGSIRMLSCYNSTGYFDDAQLFLKVEQDGYLQLFKYYYTAASPTYIDSNGMTSGGGSSTACSYLSQKDGTDMVIWHRGIFNKKWLNEYFSDCPLLLEKINSHELKKSNIHELVKFYNQQCAN